MSQGTSRISSEHFQRRNEPHSLQFHRSICTIRHHAQPESTDYPGAHASGPFVICTSRMAQNLIYPQPHIHNHIHLTATHPALSPTIPLYHLKRKSSRSQMDPAFGLSTFSTCKDNASKLQVAIRPLGDRRRQVPSEARRSRRKERLWSSRRL